MEATANPTESDWINLSKYLSKCSNSGVYVIYATRGDDKIPFYIGQSKNVAARLGDYARASFAADTDFKVGRTVRLLEERGYEILVEIERTSDRWARERELIKRHSDRPLLNSVPGYKYKTAKEDEELSRLEEYVRENFSGGFERPAELKRGHGAAASAVANANS
ncbi:MAG: GIY-YIG nuclease family protein [Gammaproteobacteria bacterium]|nr:GIY-YIG nuclease family protein [Gammaproteobacteria bacterium]